MKQDAIALANIAIALARIAERGSGRRRNPKVFLEDALRLVEAAEELLTEKATEEMYRQ